MPLFSKMFSPKLEMKNYKKEKENIKGDYWLKEEWKQYEWKNRTGLDESREINERNI